MNRTRAFADHHVAVSRRYFLRLGAAGAAGLALAPLWAEESPERDAALARLIGELEYLTPALEFSSVERGDPLPYTLPAAKRREVGLERETWKLEVIPDAETPAEVHSPLSVERGTTLTFADLLELGKEHAVRFLKIMTCNNIGAPLGTGLWEGVPLKHVIWKARPASRVRRAFYYGYHNDDPAQMFRSSLPIGRVLEEPPGCHPVTLAYKLNGDWIPGVRGGPVRLIVPEAYGFKSIKWLTTVVLTDLYHANDTYATESPNDVDSELKTFARFLHRPKTVRAHAPIPLTGMAQIGMSGLRKVQYWVTAAGTPWPAEDPYFTGAPWQDAEILPPPENWGGGLRDGALPEGVRGFEAATGAPERWPMRYALAHWAALLPPMAPGDYEIRCRTVDANGIGQPMPRPFRKSGRNAIQTLPVTVEV